MRITNEMMISASLRRMSVRLRSYEETQAQLGTGKRVRTPSDDPAGVSRAFSLRASLRAREQEQRNADDARSWLGVTDIQLQAATERLHKARELAVRGASTLRDEERRAIAEEVDKIREELVSIANSRHGARPIFSGFSANEPVAFDGANWVYQGDAGKSQRRVGESDVVTINVNGGDAFGFDAGDDVFTMLDTLSTQLRTDDADGVAASIGAIDTARTRVTDALGRVGATGNWVASAVKRSNDTLLTIREELAELEDVDIAEAIMELKTQETAYQATLQALARALPPSLVNFLR
jgi:flagellar hook-associated protein 3 FlgL